MGDAQSAQREGRNDAEEESGAVDDAQTEQSTGDKPLKNSGQISELTGKADSSIAEVNGHCEEDTSAVAILPPDEDVSETEKPLKEEEPPLENVEINEKESPNEADKVPMETIEMDAKQNDINESFRRFFSNIGLKLTVKRGSGETEADVPDDTNKEEPNRPEDIEDTTKETTSENAEQHNDVNIAQEVYDNDSTTCPTLTDGTSEDVLENAEEKTTESKEEGESDNADVAMTSNEGENAHLDATPEEEPHSTSPSSPEEEAVVSPIKRFFTTGIFSGLRKKKKPAEDETADKELEDFGKKEVDEAAKETVQDEPQDKEEISVGVEAATTENEHKENDPSTIIVTEPEILSSQEDKVQASPLKRLLSGSSFKKLSKKQRGGRKSSDAKLSDSGEHVSDQLQSSTESSEKHKEEVYAHSSTEAAGEKDGAWASFKKLMTPKKRIERPPLSNDETQIAGSVEEQKSNEGGQISDHSTEEGKKRKDSSVSWDSVLCGSGRRRSRKTSDSEEETHKNDNDVNKQDSGSKHGAESSLEGSNEINEIIAYSPKQTESPSEGDGGSTWKSLKRLVTPKRKARDVDESRDNVHSDSEVTQDESSFSIKKLLPGRKKRKSAEKQDQVSSDEADKDVASADEDSETPAVVPLSEFDTVETEVHIQTQADVETHIPMEVDLLDEMAEPVLPCDSLQTEAKKVQDKGSALESKAPAAPAKNEEHDDLTDSSSNQQLSDIPEEATPASATEEAARDDTIAEDLIEITSEAFTAPEPLDTTLADETEMISAVSQLSSESSKTSGNTTPVPAEYDIKETDALLNQVVETISMNPTEIPVCSEEVQSERISVSVSHQVMETFVKEEPTILEIHRKSDATSINTGLNVKELEAINEFAATIQTESLSEVNDSVSTEVVSEVPTEEFNTAEIAVDEVYEENVTEEIVKELESIDECQDVVECLFEENVAVSSDTPNGEKIVLNEDSLAETHQTETEPPQMDSQEEDSTATVPDETKDRTMEQEVKGETVPLTDIKLEPVDASKTEHVQEPELLQAVQESTEADGLLSLEKQVISEDIPAVETVADEVQASTLDSDEGIGQSPVEEVKSEDISPEETVDEPKQTAEVIVEPEASSLQSLEKELISEAIPAVKTVTEEVQASTLDSEEGSGQSPEEEVKPEDIIPEETAVDEPKQAAEVIVEPEASSLQSLEKEQISEDVPEAKTVTDQPKVETIPFSEVKLEPADASKSQHVQEPGVLKAVQEATEAEGLLSLEKDVISEDIPAVETVSDEVQASTLDSEEGSRQSLEKEVKSEDIPPEETVDEPKQTAEVIVEPEASSLQSLEKEVISEDVPEAKTVTDQHKEETIPLSEVKLEPVDASKAEHVHEPEVFETAQEATEAEGLLSLEMDAMSEDIPAVETVTEEVQVSTLDSEEGSGQSPEEEVKSEDIIPEETVDEPKQTAEVIVEPEASSLQSLEKELISEDVPKAKTVTDQPKEETVPLSEVKHEPVDASKTEHVQEPRLDSEAEGLLSLEKEVISDDIPVVEKITDEPNQEIEVRVEPEEKLPVNAAKTEQVHEPEVLPSDEKDTATESETDEVNVITEMIEGGSAQELGKQILFDDTPKPDTENVIASITDGIESEVVAQLDQALEIAEDQKIEGSQQDVGVEHKDSLPEGVAKLQTLTAVCVAHVHEEAGHVQVLEKTVFTEETTACCADNAAVTSEPQHEVHVSELQVSVEKEKESELPDTEIKTAAACVSSVHEEAGHVQALEKTAFTEETTAPCADNAAVTSEPKHEVHVSEVQVSVEKEKESALPDAEIKTAAIEQNVVCASSVDEEPSHVQVLEATTAPCVDSVAVTNEPKHEVHVSEVQVSVEKENETELPGIEINTATVCVSSVYEEASHVQALENTVFTEETPTPCEDSAAVTNEPGHEVHVSEVQVSVEKEKESELPDTKIKTAAVKHDVVCVSSVQEEASHVQVLEETTAPCVDSVTVTNEPKHEVHVSEVQVSVEKENETELPGIEINTAAVCVSSVYEEASHVQALEKTVFTEETPTPCEDSAAGTNEPGHEVHVSELQVSVEKEKESELPDTEIKTAAVEHDVVCVSSVQEEASHVQVLEETTAPCVDSVAVASEAKHEVHVSEVQVSVEKEKESELPDTEIKTTAVERAEVCVPSVHEEASHVQVIEKSVITEESTIPCVEGAAVTSEPKHEVHVSAVQVSVEREKERELPAVAVEYAAVVAQVVTCNLKGVSVVLPDVLLENTTTVTEPLIDGVTSELVFNKEDETAIPLVKDDVAETAEEGTEVVMMHVPSVEFEDNGRIQVQVIDVDKKSAAAVVDTVLDAGVTEAKEVIDVCHETIKQAENLSATSEIEEVFINEENMVTVQEVIEHFKENSPETVPESTVVNLEQEGEKQPEAETEVSMIVEKESNEVEDQKAMEDSVATFRERQDEAPAFVNEDSATEKQVSKDIMQTPDVPGLEVSIHDQKKDLEEIKVEEVRSSSEELDAKTNNEEAQVTQIAQSPTVTPSNTGVEVPQNSGIISSEGNVESPVSVLTEVSEVRVQASEPVTQEAENQKLTELTEVAVLETEITKPLANLDSTERAIIISQPIQLNVSIQEPVEEIQSTERVTSSVQATETTQPVSQAEKREVLLSQQVLSEAFDQETKAEESVQQKEEENDQDVWMDAEEDIYIQEETKAPLCEADKPLDPQTESRQEEKSVLEHEVEMTPKLKTEKESQTKMQETADTCEIDSEGEDFAVALEHPETSTASLSTVKWD